MNTDKKIISLYNFLKKEGFEDEADLVKSAIIKIAIDDLGTLPAETEAGGGVAALREDSRYTIDTFNDAVKNVVWDVPTKYWMSKPEYVENISLAGKAIGVVLTAFPELASSAAGPVLIKSTAGLDAVAAIARLKQGENFKAFLNMLSAIVSLPTAALKGIFSLLLSDKIIRVFAIALRSQDRGAFAVTWGADKVVASLPLVIDLLIGSLENLRDVLNSPQDIHEELSEVYAAQLQDQCSIHIEGLQAQKEKINQIKNERT